MYNGEKSLCQALDSLLAQTFPSFELIISDNASSDSTETICRKYAARDNRIRYVRQTTNIGAAANFKFVLDEACGEYFMWAACDDIRSYDFIEVNHKFLTESPDYVASTSPNGFEGKELSRQNLVNFKLDGGDLFERFTTFFKYCWVSHGIFYSLIRTNTLRNCEVLGQSFIAADWAIDLYLASKGKLNRTPSGQTVFGVRGISGSGGYKAFRNDLIDRFLPFYRLTKYVIKLTNGFTIKQKLIMAMILIKLNIWVAYDQARAQLYSIYCKYIRPKIRHE